MHKGYFSAVVVGATVEERIAQEFAEKCAPLLTTTVIEAFIHGVINGDVKFVAKAGERE